MNAVKAGTRTLDGTPVLLIFKTPRIIISMLISIQKMAHCRDSRHHVF
jgi:hypothetical protein